MKEKKISVSSNTALSILMLVLVAVLLLFSVFLVRVKLLENTQNLGMALAKSYAVEEEMHLDSFRQIIILAAQYVDEIDSDAGNGSEVQSWLQDYFSKLTVMLGENMVDPYAVIDGEIVAANPWDGDAAYDYRSTDWYQDALAAGGEVVFSDVYQDAITGEPVFTISKALARSGDVLAMDVYIHSQGLHNTTQTLPGNSSYYLCDTNGTLLYTVTRWQTDEKTLQMYADYLMEGIRDGSLFAYDTSITDMEGVERGVYYSTMSNGWTVIMTIPIRTILMGDRNMVVNLLAGVAVLLFAVLTAMVIRDLQQNKRIKKAGNTIRILSDSFYAVYRVNFREGTYEAIKMSRDLESQMPRTGGYDFLLATVKQVVESGTYQEFELSFSLESIRQRVSEHIADYGGDYRRRFGEIYKWVNIRTLYDEKLAPDEVILCFRDVDIEKRQQLQHTIILQEALEAAKKSTKAKSDFFSSMSHDMRTPLNAIIGFSQLAQNSQGDCCKMRDYMQKIEFSGKQLLALINDILELSKMEAGKNALNNKRFNLKQYVEESAGIFRTQAEHQGKHFSVELDIRNEEVVGDEFKIGQILNNLLSNSLKYSNPGADIRLEVRQFDFQRHSKYQIVVEDTGIGMSKSFLEHLFDPYARETCFTSAATVGTGLGMPIVKSLVQQMSGEISVESTLGKGSKFTVTLPLEAVSGEEDAQEKKEEQSSPFQLAGRKILLAEDNELNMEIATEILSMNDVEVLQAVNGAEAVRIFQAAAPYSIDAILMDMQMPEMDGCQAARAIRALDKPDAATVPIIAVTANAFAEDIAKTTEAGMNGHISKPIDVSLLYQALEKCMKHE
ncbi:ATP-binding protein [uncultured Pseudoflavonifractor sp.]|uniref:ATP-binding protein n=1 Tax=uncultured Pseudoflavonifractor sp. TaxID=1221379 RepID=UPI0025F61750|nr:ATP-binding protein [uncultured Pseudoflavonifractor sp.]